jgi:hypothetical protein
MGKFLKGNPDFLYARIKLQIEMGANLNAKFTIPSGSRLRAQKPKITYLLSHQVYIRTSPYYGNCSGM